MKHRSVKRRRGNGAPEAGRTMGLPPEIRYAPLVGHYNIESIARVAGVPEWTLRAMDTGSGVVFRWQPEEDRLLRNWPDAVCSRLLPWRTPTAIRSRRRDIGCAHSRNAVDMLTNIAITRLENRLPTT